jgi:DNA-binding transcriptional MerR regulator
MSLQQLDLFGFPVNPEPLPKKKEPLLVKSAIIEIEEKIEPIILAEKSKRGRPKTKKIAKETNQKKSKRGRKPYAEVYADIDLSTVPNEDQLKAKLYYPISEVAKWFNITHSQLRFWENEFDILQPRKNRKGDRLFRPEDIKNLKTIYYLLRNKKMTIEAAKDCLKANQHKVEPAVQLQQSLQNLKTFILELKANLD